MTKEEQESKSKPCRTLNTGVVEEQEEPELFQPERWGNPAARVGPHTSFDSL